MELAAAELTRRVVRWGWWHKLGLDGLVNAHARVLTGPTTPGTAPPSHCGELGKALGHQGFQLPPPFHCGLFPVLHNPHPQASTPGLLR